MPTPKPPMTWDALGHVVNFVAIVIAAVYFIAEQKAQTELLAHELSSHIKIYAHDGMSKDARLLQINMVELTGAVQHLVKEVQELEQKIDAK